MKKRIKEKAITIWFEAKELAKIKAAQSLHEEFNRSKLLRKAIFIGLDVLKKRHISSKAISGSSSPKE